MVVSDPDSEEEDDDDQEKQHTSDSEEDELASLPRIHQLPEATSVPKPATTEDMDVSSADGIELSIWNICLLVLGVFLSII
jgi:hypothetical protein